MYYLGVQRCAAWQRRPLPATEPSTDAEGWTRLGHEAPDVSIRVVQAEGFPDVFCVQCTAEGPNAHTVPPLDEANSLLDQYNLDDSIILTWDPTSRTKPTLQQDETERISTVHDKLKGLLGKPPYIMLRTHKIGAGTWTAGLASREKSRYRCAQLAMMVALYASDHDLPLGGSEAQKALMRAARRL